MITDLELEDEQVRLGRLDFAVRSYLAHLWAFEQGSTQDGRFVEYWRDQMTELTGDDDE